MKLRDYRTYFLTKLAPIYDSIEAESFFHITLEALKGWNRSDLAMNPNEVMHSDEIEKWNKVLSQLEGHKPIQYIFGKAHFYGLELEVNENTLIPRPETEELVEWIIAENRHNGKIRILDIGTGSGCIAIAMAKNLPDADVFAIDVSGDALAVAQRNSANNNTGVSFIQQDILNAEALGGEFDIIVSNPPYVRHLEKAEINKNVLEYEPHLALFVEDNDALLFYRRIALLAKTSLNPNGKLYFEINQYLGSEMTFLLEDMQFRNIELRKDIYGNDRMIRSTV